MPGFAITGGFIVAASSSNEPLYAGWRYRPEIAPAEIPSESCAEPGGCSETLVRSLLFCVYALILWNDPQPSLSCMATGEILQTISLLRNNISTDKWGARPTAKDPTCLRQRE
jgi:hypothetical protein